MFINRRDVTIEWGDCDAAGIVFYPRYFAMFDTSTALLFAAALGMPTRDMLKHFGIMGIPMVDTRAQFHIPSSFGDIVQIESQIAGIGRSSIEIGHRLLRSGALAVECKEKRVWVGYSATAPGNIQSVPIPQEVIDRLSRQG